MLVNDLEGHDGCTVLQRDVGDPPAWATADDYADDGVLKLEGAHAAAMAEIKHTEEANQPMDLVAAVATIETWNEIKRAERDIEENKVPSDPQGLAERYPFVWAISQLANIDMLTAKDLAKEELIGSMRDIAFVGAQALISRRQVREATTVQAVQAITDAAVADIAAAAPVGEKALAAHLK